MNDEESLSASPAEGSAWTDGRRGEGDPIRVGVLGARGRMGTEVCRAVDAAADLELVAMIDMGDGLFSALDAGAERVPTFARHPAPADPCV